MEIAAAVAIVGTLIQVGGQVVQGIQNQAAGQARANMAESDAQLVEKYAAKEESNFRQQGEQIKGQQQIMVGASGVEASGTPLLVMAETARKLEEDALTIRQRGADEAARLRKMGTYYQQQGDDALFASLLNAGGTLLTQGAKTYNAFNNNYNPNALSYEKPQTTTTSLPGKVNTPYINFGTY